MTVINIFLISLVLLGLSLGLSKIKKFRVEKREGFLIILGAVFLTSASLLVVVKKIGGTILYTSYGWPHFFLTHNIKDVIDGTLALQWNFIPGWFFVYPLANFIFYFSVVLFIFFIIRLFAKTAKQILIALVTGIIILSLPLIQSQRIKEIYIKGEIKKANYCQIDSDCVDAGGSCPFDCYAYVNKDEVARIGGLINSYHSTCTYGCVSCPSVVCEDNRCRLVCEGDIGFD